MDGCSKSCDSEKQIYINVAIARWRMYLHAVIQWKLDTEGCNCKEFARFFAATGVRTDVEIMSTRGGAAAQTNTRAWDEGRHRLSPWTSSSFAVEEQTVAAEVRANAGTPLPW